MRDRTASLKLVPPAKPESSADLVARAIDQSMELLALYVFAWKHAPNLTKKQREQFRTAAMRLDEALDALEEAQ